MAENYNGKRSNIISSLKRKNLKLVKQIRKEINSMNIDNVHEDSLLRFEKNIIQCANLTLYKKDVHVNSLTYITSHTCDHKACFICNYIRQKKIRRKYMRWFQDNPVFAYVEDKKGAAKLVTRFQYHNKYDGQKILYKVKYDIMFLTLTVPHSKDGFRGEKFYQREFRNLFNRLRKTDGWKQWVYGGEFGLEITRKENGLHIHIHSLIFVKRGTQNRNQLHRIIFIEWNKLTIDRNRKKEDKQLPKNILESIKDKTKNNKYWTKEDYDNLDGRGALIINLRSVYNHQNGNKQTIKEFGGKAMLIATMEAISYHFEPTAFDKAKGEFDLPLLVELLPVLYNLRIYDRFGILYRETPLSLKDNSYLEDMEEVLELKENNIEAQLSNQEYFITNPAYVFHAVENNHKIIMSHEANRRRIDLSSGTTSDAMAELSTMVKQMHKRN
jgi:hypothetical protein